MRANKLETALSRDHLASLAPPDIHGYGIWDSNILWSHDSGICLEKHFRVGNQDFLKLRGGDLEIDHSPSWGGGAQ